MDRQDLNKLVQLLEKEACSICNAHPKVEAEDGKLLFTWTCCSRFKEQLLKYAQHEAKKLACIKTAKPKK